MTTATSTSSLNAEKHTLAIVKNAASRYFSVIDLEAKEVIDRLGDGRYPHTAVFHPNGRYAYLLYISSAHLEVVDLATLDTVGTVENLGTMSVGSALTDDGEYLFIGTGVALPETDSPGILAFEIGANGIPKRVGSRVLSRCSGMQIGHDGRLYVALKEAGEVIALSSDRTLEIEDRYTVGTKPHDLYPIPGTNRLVVNNAGEASASVIDPNTDVVHEISTGENPHGIAFDSTQSARRAVFPAREETCVTIANLGAVDENNDPTEARLEVGTTTGFAATSPNGRYVIVDAYDAPYVTIIDVTTPEVKRTVTVGGEPLHVVFGPDGRECYVGNMDRSELAVLDTEPLLDGRPDDVELDCHIEGLGEKPSGIFIPEVIA
ncbi:MAG: YncE family protein [Halobacteriales archaeon]|nr:YncE family protein [Halobacteriales archaeon]